MEIENSSRLTFNENDFSDMVDRMCSPFARAIIRGSKFKIYNGYSVHQTLPCVADAQLEDDSVHVLNDILKVLEEYFKYKISLKIYYKCGKELLKW